MKKVVKDGILELHIPQNPAPVIFDSPHSGSIYPTDFQYNCDSIDLRRVEDKYVDTLFARAPEYGAAFLLALFPRSYIDVNRAIDDIDENLFEGKWPDMHGLIKPSSRSDTGIGLITRLLKPGHPVYERQLSPNEIVNRIKNYYEPYHEILSKTLDDAYYNHGQFWHINCHSMPSSSAYPKRNITMLGNTPKQSDIVLGDRDGQSCGRDFLYALRDFWRSAGFRVTVNDPFSGVELVSRYSQPTRGKNSIQIEINRSLYMNEETGETTAQFTSIHDHCNNMIKFCVDFAHSKRTNMAAD